MSKLENLNDLFMEELRDLYDAEQQILKALPELEEAAHSADLKIAFHEHRLQTAEHVLRLESIFESLGQLTKGSACKAMKGLVAEAKGHGKENATPAVRDASLIAAAQRVEHYEIAGYGTARTFAATLGYNAAADLLQQTLQEEAATDARLSALATGLNAEAMLPTTFGPHN